MPQDGDNRRFIQNMCCWTDLERLDLESTIIMVIKVVAVRDLEDVNSMRSNDSQVVFFW